MSSPGNESLRLRARHVVGQPEAVRTALASAHAQGRLVGLRSPARLADGRVSITAELLEPASARTARTVRFHAGGLRPWLIGAGVLAGLATVATLVWLLVLAVLAVIALITTVVGWVAAHLVVILVGLGVLVLLAGGGGCPGIHCGGCWR